MSKPPEQSMVTTWVEEGAVASINTEKNQKHSDGHRRLLSMEQGAKMEDTTTVRATYVPPRGPGVRLIGRRRELLEQHLTQTIREQIELQMKDAPCDPESCCSVTQESFTIPGFVPLTERLTPVHDYTSEPSITFWSENRQRIEGVTPVRSPGAPFRKCSEFSRPISERVDDPALASED